MGIGVCQFSGAARGVPWYIALWVAGGLIVGCSGESAPGEAAGDVGPASGLTVQIDAPAAGLVSGVVTIDITAGPTSVLAALELVTPPGLVDQDPAPDRFLSEWDTLAVPDGPATVLARATDKAGEVVVSQVTVTVENAGAGRIGGRVWVAGPVRGATVEVVGFAGLQEGAVLAAGTTNELGKYDLSLNVPGYDNLVLVRVSGAGAVYESWLTGAEHAFGAADRLESALRYQDGGKFLGNFVTPLTTIGVRLAQARLDLEGESPEEALAWSMTALREHVFRPDPEGRGVRTVEPIDPTAMKGSALQATTAVGLVHAGLEQLAAEASVPEVGVSALEYIAALADDLADGFFDGKGADGSSIVVGTHVLDPEATRWALAAAVDGFVGGPRNGTGLVHQDLAEPGLLYDDLALDAGPLYPSSSPPQPYDPVSPELLFVAPTPDAETWQAKPFSVAVQAQDKSLPVTFALEEPPAEPESASSESATFVIDPAEHPDGELLVRAVATDAAGNSTAIERIFRIDTTAPALEIVAPGSSWVGSAELEMSGLASDVGSGVTSVVVAVDQELITAELSDGTWTAPVTLPTSLGAVDVKVEARDGAGNASVVATALQVDLTAPQLKVLTPLASHPYPSGAMTVIAEVVDEQSGVAQVTAALAGAAAVELALEPGKASGDLSIAAGATAAEVTVSATSGVGAVETRVVAFVVDDVPPTFDSVTLGALLDGTHWVTGPTAVLTVSGVAEHGPDHALTDKGTISILGLLESVTKAFGAAGDYELTVNLAGALPTGSIEVVVADVAGNATGAALDVALDAGPPTLAVTSHPNGGWVASPDVVLSGTVTDSGAGVASVIVAFEGDVTPALVDADAWSAKITLPKGPGPFNLVITATDLTGQPTAMTWSLGVDATPPKVDVQAPVSGQPVSSGPLLVKVAASDTDTSVVGCAASLDGQPPTALALVGGIWVGPVALAGAEGDHNVAVTCVNTAGLEQVVVVDVLLDQTQPTFEAIQLGTLWQGTHWVTSSDEVLTLIGLADGGPPNALAGKGTIVVTGGAAPVVEPFGAPGDYSLILSLGPDFVGGPITVAIEDVAGNSAVSTLQVGLDTLPPVVEVTSPAPGAWLAESSVLLEGLATDVGAGVAAVSVTLGQDSLAATVVDGVWELVLSLPKGSGTHELLVVVTDGAGRSSEVPWTLSVDDSPPGVEITSHQPLHPYAKGAQPIVAVVEEPDSPLAALTAVAVVDGQSFPLQLDGATVGGEITLPALEGPHEVVVEVTNASGLVGTDGVVVVVDNSPPTWDSIELGVQYEGTHVVATVGPKLRLVGLEDAGPANAQEVKGTITVSAPGVTQMTVPFTAGKVAHELTLELVKGAKGALEIVVTDAAGNAAPALLTFIHDFVPPAVHIVSPGNNEWLPAATAQVSGTASDQGSTITSVVVSVAGGLPVEATLDGGAWTAQIEVPTEAKPSAVVATATDLVGNTATDSVTVLVDSSAPEVQTTSPAAGSPHPPGAIPVSAVVSEQHSPVVAVEACLAPGTCSALALQGAIWSGSVDSTPNDGVAALVVSATNAAGLQGASAPFEVVIDGSAPTWTGVELGWHEPDTKVHWVGSTTPTLVVLGLADTGPPNSLALKGTLQVGGAASASLEFGPPGDYELPLELGGGFEAGAVEITAIDVAGNASSVASLAVARDSTAPEIMPRPPFHTSEVWTNQGAADLHVDATDTGAGVAGVVVEGALCDGGPCVGVLTEGTPAAGTWLVSGAVFADSTQVLQIVATDQVGHSAVHEVKVQKDQTPPVIEHLTTSYGREHAGLYASGATCDSPVPAPLTSTDTHTLSAGVFEGGPPVIEKLANRLEYQSPSDVDDQNLPVILVGLQDSSAPPSALGRVFRFLRGTTSLHEGVLEKPAAGLEEDEYQVPIAIPWFSDASGASDFGWQAGQIPDRLEIEVTDLAGNSTTRSWEFELRLHAPPPCVEVSPDKTLGPRDFESFSLDELTAHEMFTPGAPSVRVGQMRVRNPFDVPLRLELPGQVTVKPATGSRRAAFFLSTSPASCNATSCGAANANPLACMPCNFSAGGGVGQCTSWDGSAAALQGPSLQTATASGLVSAHLPESKDLLDTALPAGTDGAHALAPGEALYLNLAAELGGVCVLATPEQFTDVTLPGPSTDWTIYVPPGAGCASPTSGDEAACHQLLFGPQSLLYATPRYVDELSIAVPQLSMQVSSAAGGEVHSQPIWTSGAVALLLSQPIPNTPTFDD